MRFANFLRIPCLQNTSGRVLLKFSLTIFVIYLWKCLTLSWWRPLSYRNQSIDFGSKPMNWLLYDNGLRLERVNNSNVIKPYHKLISKRYHCVKCVQIRSNFWSVFSRIQNIQSECGKITTRNYTVFGHFSRSVFHWELILKHLSLTVYLY